MKKLIALLLICAVGVWTFGPVLAGAEENGNITTGLTKDTSGGVAPIVKAKWEAKADSSVFTDYYEDDATTAGAQFLASGEYEVNKKIALCAVVTDPDGLSDVDAVYADVFYPEGIALGDSHVALADQSGLGCGKLMQEDTMTRLSKAEGIQLFCTNVRTHNYNLPVFNTDPITYTYDEICATDGELMKETAAVYCATKEISYEDPSGDYTVWAVAQDGNGQQGKLVNHFTYLRMTAYQVDFNSIQYGNVRLNTHKIISGDLTWDGTMGANKASVRNVGNTRLTMGVWQDDMNFGQTDGNWNVLYDARVGSNAGFTNYWPNATALKYINDSLDLSELDEMDFSILVSKFPPTETCFSGTMTLGAKFANHLTDCTQ